MSALLKNALILILLFGPWYGGDAKRMGGEKRTRERGVPKMLGPLQKSFWSAVSWIFAQEKPSTDT